MFHRISKPFGLQLLNWYVLCIAGIEPLWVLKESAMQQSKSIIFYIPALTLLFLLVSSELRAQKTGYYEWYIITLEGDTLSGLIKDRQPGPFEQLYTKVRYKKKWQKKK